MRLYLRDPNTDEQYDVWDCETSAEAAFIASVLDGDVATPDYWTPEFWSLVEDARSFRRGGAGHGRSVQILLEDDNGDLYRPGVAPGSWLLHWSREDPMTEEAREKLIKQIREDIRETERGHDK